MSWVKLINHHQA